MNDFLLVIAMIAIVIYGYFVMKKVDDFIEKNQKSNIKEPDNTCCQIKISAHSPVFFDAIAPSLEICSEANPYIEFFFSSGNVDHLLAKLKDEAVDIVLLSKIDIEQMQSNFAFTKIPYEHKQDLETTLGIPFKNIEEEDYLYIVWNKNVKSKNRDRVIFILENECGRLNNSK